MNWVMGPAPIQEAAAVLAALKAPNARSKKSQKSLDKREKPLDQREI